MILDLFFNHTARATASADLSLRGFDEALYYAHAPDGRLVNDTARATRSIAAGRRFAR